MAEYYKTTNTWVNTINDQQKTNTCINTINEQQKTIKTITINVKKNDFVSSLNRAEISL